MTWADAPMSLTTAEAAERLSQFELWSRLVNKFHRTEEKLLLSRRFHDDYPESQDLRRKDWSPQYVRLTTSELVMFDLAHQVLEEDRPPIRCVMSQVGLNTAFLDEYIAQKDVEKAHNWPGMAITIGHSTVWWLACVAMALTFSNCS